MAAIQPALSYLQILVMELEAPSLRLITGTTTFKATNQSGSTIAAGTLVAIVGVVDELPSIVAASASSALPDKSPAYGFTAESIANLASGKVYVQGTVPDLATTGISPGTPVYLSAVTPGAFTGVMPTLPNAQQVVGNVVLEGAAGSIHLSITPVDLEVSGTITATAFVGDGSGLTGIVGGGGSTDAGALTTGLVALARGGTHTDLSLTGGAGKVLKQVTAGADITVGTLSASDVGAAATAHVHAGTDITSGTLDVLRMPTNVALKDAANTFTLANNFSGGISVDASLLALSADLDIGSTGTPWGRLYLSDTLYTKEVRARTNALGATTLDGVVAENLAAAAAGAQQWSPATRWAGKLWSTNAGGSSLLSEYRAYVETVQDQGGDWKLQSQIDGGGWLDALRVNYAGELSSGGSRITLHDVPNDTYVTFSVNDTAYANRVISLPVGSADGTLALVGDAPTAHVHAGEDITSGTLDDARLSANVALLGAATASFGFDLTCGGDFWSSGNVNGLAGNFSNLAITNGATLGSTVAVTIPAAGTVGAWIKGYAGQTANLQEWRDSSGSAIAYLAPDGRLSANGLVSWAGIEGNSLTLDGNISTISNGNQIGDSAVPWYSIYLSDFVAFEKSGHEMRISPAALTADRTITLPNATGTVPLLEAANTFTGLPQTVQHDGIAGGSLTPTGDLVLANTTLAGRALAAYADQHNSPGLFFLAQQWNGGASVQGGAALHFKTLPNTGQGGILQVSCKYYPTGAWERVFDFPSLGPFGPQEGASYYAFRHKGVNNFELGLYIQKLDGFTAGLALGRDAGTNGTYVRSLAAALPVYVQDSAGAATPLWASELRAVANGFTAGFKGPSALAANKTWTLPLTDAAGVMQSDGSGALSFASYPSSMVHEVVTAATKTMVSRTSYQANRATIVTFTLPLTAAVGEQMAVKGVGVGGWTLAQLAGQSIHFGDLSTTTGVNGAISSMNQYDAILLECSVANLEWVAFGLQGTMAVV